jgi:hypothetical protein
MNSCAEFRISALSRKRSFTHRPLIRGDAPTFLECALIDDDKYESRRDTGGRREAPLSLRGRISAGGNPNLGLLVSVRVRAFWGLQDAVSAITLRLLRIFENTHLTPNDSGPSSNLLVH